MSWTALTVELTARARRDVKGLDAGTRERVLRAIARYASTGHGDVKRLQASEEYRLRVEDWRVRFDVVAGEAIGGGGVVEAAATDRWFHRCPR